MPVRVYVMTNEHNLKNKEAGKKRSQDPEWRRKQKEGAQKRSQDPEWRRKVIEANQKKAQTPEWQRKQKEMREKIYQDPEWQRKQKEGAQKRSQDPEWRRKIRYGVIKSYKNHKTKENHKEALIGGFWYGNVRYNERSKYCERWTDDLRRRIRLFFGNKSILSGVKGNGRKLSCHHVYYQKKACCEWDEDTQGYYAIINGEKYYIDDDPNKFVPLTVAENRIVECNKLKYIKIFEDIIKKRFNGICYYTKKEYDWIMSIPEMNEISHITGTYFPPDFDHGR